MTTPTGPQAQEAGVQRIEEAPLYWKLTKQDAATGYCNGWNDCLAAVAETATPARVVSDEVAEIAASLRDLAAVIRKHGTCAPMALEVVAERVAALSTLQSGAEGKDGGDGV